MYCGILIYGGDIERPMPLKEEVTTYISQEKETYHSEQGHRGSIRMRKTESGDSIGVSAGKSARQNMVKGLRLTIK